ncbi:MAG: flagellar biosynthetic protein FliO [Oscillospiraceae bacterium]|nr:flagellar biosynthetic protein FliO [Oscillospiraceae bacterium]
MQEIITILISLIAVIGIMVLSMFGLKKLMKKFNFQNQFGSGMKIISCMGIGQDKSLAAVSVGTKKLLLGITATEIKVLTELSDEDIEMLMPPEQAQPDGRSFAEILAENMKNTFGGNKKGGSK